MFQIDKVVSRDRQGYINVTSMTFDPLSTSKICFQEIVWMSQASFFFFLISSSETRPPWIPDPEGDNAGE